MTTVPPAFAARLLKRLVPKQDHDALLGDLCEEYQRGRSLLWYLVQILAAILVGSWKDANTRRGIALGAIMSGFVLQIVFGASLLAIRVTGREYSPWAPELWSILESYELLRSAGVIAVGWLLVSLYRSYGMTMLLATHEMGFARQVADRVVFMDMGEVVEINAPAQFFGAPQHERTKLFLSQILH